MEEILLPGWFSLLYYTTQDHVARDGTAHSGLGLPISVKKVPAQSCLQAHPKETNLQLRFPLPIIL